MIVSSLLVPSVPVKRNSTCQAALAKDWDPIGIGTDSFFFQLKLSFLSWAAPNWLTTPSPEPDHEPSWTSSPLACPLHFWVALGAPPSTYMSTRSDATALASCPHHFRLMGAHRGWHQTPSRRWWGQAGSDPWIELNGKLGGNARGGGCLQALGLCPSLEFNYQG